MGAPVSPRGCKSWSPSCCLLPNLLDVGCRSGITCGLLVFRSDKMIGFHALHETCEATQYRGSRKAVGPSHLDTKARCMIDR